VQRAHRRHEAAFAQVGRGQEFRILDDSHGLGRSVNSNRDSIATATVPPPPSKPYDETRSQRVEPGRLGLVRRIKPESGEIADGSQTAHLHG
jgi:hypothetical protein